MRKGLLVTLGVALASLLTVATWAADEVGYAAHGTVKGVDASAGTVTIDHEDIPGLMMGMTMTFSVSDPRLLRGVAAGQLIDFRVRKDGNQYIVTEIRPAAGSETPGGHQMMMRHGGCCHGMMRAPGRQAPPCHHDATQPISCVSGQVGPS